VTPNFPGLLSPDNDYRNMLMDKITTAQAWSMRFNRGLDLPTNREYVNPLVKLIAMRRAELQAELKSLDNELDRMTPKMY
jgi:hypothetical protein